MYLKIQKDAFRREYFEIPPEQLKAMVDSTPNVPIQKSGPGSYAFTPGPDVEPPLGVKKIRAGKDWTIIGPVSEVQYGDGDMFVVEDQDINRDGTIKGIMCKDKQARIMECIHSADDEGNPLFRLIWFVHEGEHKVIATQLPVYLCSDKGDTIEKLC